MLSDADFETMARLIRDGAPEAMQRETARAIQLRLNPHPAGQATLNVPTLDGERVPGLQHKYRETVLFFPSQGQTATPTARIASAGPNSWGSTRSRRARPSASSRTSRSIPK
ncbi:MAG: hypothetical protein OHK0013_03950 [Sandaracinaceae bacterium]